MIIAKLAFSSLPPFPTMLSAIISQIDYLPEQSVAGSAWENQSRHVVLDICLDNLSQRPEWASQEQDGRQGPGESWAMGILAADGASLDMGTVVLLSHNPACLLLDFLFYWKNFPPPSCLLPPWSLLRHGSFSRRKLTDFLYTL